MITKISKMVANFSHRISKKWLSMSALVAMIVTAESMNVLFWLGFITLVIVSFHITDEERRA